MKNLSITSIESFRTYLKNNKEFRRDDIENLYLYFLEERSLTDIFQVFKFKNLKRLFMYQCNITNAKFLDYVNIRVLSELKFSQCNILTLSDLKKYCFPKLKLLHIDTTIKNINFLPECNMPKLNSLIIYSNIIEDTHPIFTSNFPELSFIEIYLPKLKNILHILLANFPNLNCIRCSYDNKNPKKFYDLPYKKYVKTKKYKIDILFAGRMIKNMDLLELINLYIYKIHERLLINRVKEKIKKLKINPFTDI